MDAPGSVIQSGKPCNVFILFCYNGRQKWAIRKLVCTPPLSNDRPCLKTNPWSDRNFGVRPLVGPQNYIFFLRMAFSGGQTATFGGIWGGRTALFSPDPLVRPRLWLSQDRGGGGLQYNSRCAQIRQVFNRTTFFPSILFIMNRLAIRITFESQEVENKWFTFLGLMCLVAI